VTVAIYVRVSSRSQDTRSQERDLRAWARAQAEKVTWYRDHHTGTSMERPGMNRLVAAARTGQIQRLVVWRLDRLGRTARGLLTVLEELQGLGVGFVSLREGFDLATPAGRLMAGILASVSAYETEVRRERQVAGIAKARELGKRWGGRKPGTRVKVTSEKEALIRRLCRRGETVAAIARATGLTRKTVYQVARRAG
jgi:DNA invertase Pin-like site-specific DNA recombinase